MCDVRWCGEGRGKATTQEQKAVQKRGKGVEIPLRIELSISRGFDHGPAANLHRHVPAQCRNATAAWQRSAEMEREHGQGKCTPNYAHRPWMCGGTRTRKHCSPARKRTRTGFAERKQAGGMTQQNEVY